MLGLTLRDEFRGKRLKGTAIELSNDSNTGATQIAAQQDGSRVPTIERHAEHYLHAPTNSPKLSYEQRQELFMQVVEPTLQRELNHKGAATGDGSYTAELIGYVEISN